MKFRNWIKQQGVSTVCDALGLHYSTPYKWLNEKKTPHTATMVKLVRLGKGAFTFEDIIRETKTGNRVGA